MTDHTSLKSRFPADAINSEPESSDGSSTDETVGKVGTLGQKICSKRIVPLRHPPFTLGPDSATFTIAHRDQYIPAAQTFFRNSLLVSVGYLELANAGDFAANVWNEVPVPTFAVALMAIGGILALSLSYLAFKDARLSWINLRLLREERGRLQAQAPGSDEEAGRTAGGIDNTVLLDMSRREIGAEFVDRLGMELLMGCGSVLVGIGTLMAIGGANHDVYVASNLLSGYVGNSMAAVYGLVNGAWSTFIWVRAHFHGLAAAQFLTGNFNESVVRPRLRTVKTHALVNGFTGLIAGVASLLTATRWWGYVILAPCIVSTVWCNYYWRRTIGYDRPIIRQFPASLEWASVAQELEFVSFARQVLADGTLSSSYDHFPNHHLDALEPKSLPSIVDFLVRNDLFEDFGLRILQDKSLSSSLFDVPGGDIITITSQALLEVDPQYISRILGIAYACINDIGPQRLRDRERYLIDILGCALCRSSSLACQQ